MSVIDVDCRYLQMRYYTIYSYNVRIKLKFTVTLYNILVEIDNAFYTLNIKNSVIHFILKCYNDNDNDNDNDNVFILHNHI